MASIKVKYRPSMIAGHEGSIYYQIIHERRVRQLLTAYRVYDEEWDDTIAMAVARPQSRRCNLISVIRERIKRDIERLVKIVRRLNESGLSYDTDEIIAQFHRYSNECSLFNYMESIIARLKHNGKNSTADNYKSTLLNFRNFLSEYGQTLRVCGDGDITLDNLTANIIEDYEVWLRDKGVVPNTSSFYMRTLRAVYNRAVDDEIIDNNNPFRRVYTGVDKTVKRAISIDAVKRMKLLDLSFLPKLRYARDMFLLSFCLRGMSFIDMAYLHKSDIKNGFVIYRRRKTGQLLTIKWTDEMQMILENLEPSTSEYLLPILNDGADNQRKCYKNTLRAVNHNLKKIGEMIELTIPLTMYVARHSWASAAKTKRIPMSVISEGMGHNSETTTRIYLASLETSIVDNANSLILSELK